MGSRSGLIIQWIIVDHDDLRQEYVVVIVKDLLVGRWGEIASGELKADRSGYEFEFTILCYRYVKKAQRGVRW
jgi:hypothetical protein